jgi:hypothetical protein
VLKSCILASSNRERRHAAIYTVARLG